MTDNVTIPAQGQGSVTPVVEAVQQSSSGNPYRQTFSLAGTGYPGNHSNLAAIGTNVPSGTIPIVGSDVGSLYSGSVSTTGPSSWFDTTGFQSVAIQATGLIEAVITVEGSNDGVNPGLLMLLALDEFTLVDNISKYGNFALSTSTQYIRFNVQQITGTAALTIIGRSGRGPQASDAISLAVGSDQTLSINANLVSETGNRLASTGANVPIGTLPVVSSDGVVIYIGNISGPSVGNWLDTTGFGSVVIQIAGAIQSNIRIEGCNDGINPSNLLVLSLDEFVLIDTITKYGNFSLSTSTKYIRFNVIEITGDQNGPIATVTIIGRSGPGPQAADAISLAMTGDQSLPINTNIVSGGGKFDVNGAEFISDAPAPIPIHAAANTIFYLDTQGYQSFNITSETLAGTVTASNDGITWSALTGVPLIFGTATSSVAAGTAYSFPCIARYIRISVTTAGWATGFLRSQPWTGAYQNAPVNIAQINGSGTVSALAGVLAVGGNIAVAVAPTADPVPLGTIDPGGTTAYNSSGFTRRVISDTSGRILLAGQIPSGVTPSVATGPISLIPQSFQNQPAVNVQDTSVFEGESYIEILAQLLVEMKILNQQLYELPNLLNAGITNPVDEPQTYREDPSIFNNRAYSH